VGLHFSRKSWAQRLLATIKITEKKLEKMTGCFARIFSNFYGYSVLFLFFVLHNIALEQNY